MASDGYLESLSKLNFPDPSHQPLKPTATTSSVNSYPTVSLLPTHPSFSPRSWSAQQASTYLDFYGIRKVGKAGKETSCFLIYCCNDFHEGPFSRRPPPPQPQACLRFPHMPQPSAGDLPTTMLSPHIVLGCNFPRTCCTFSTIL